MPTLRECLSEAAEARLLSLKVKGNPTPRVHRLSTLHKVPPEPRAYRAPRMGNAPRFVSGSMNDVCDYARSFGARSRALLNMA